ncbi:MAG: acyltransferase family protein, partial [Pseudomonadota bacterium]
MSQPPDPGPIVAGSRYVRYHYMDNLRALAMLAGVLFHAALAYSPFLHEVWLGSSPQKSVAMDALAWFSHLFRMPLFFLIAGFFAAYLVGKRGVAGFLRNRAVRILIPLVVFLPLLWAATVWLVGWALTAVENPSPLLASIAANLRNPDMPQQPLTTMHLWFLYLLVQLCLLFGLLARYELHEHRALAKLCSARFLVFGLPLLIAPALATQLVPHPAPEQLQPRLWAIVFYGLFFMTGLVLYRRQQLIDELRVYLPWLIVSSVVLYVFIYAEVPRTLSLEAAFALQQGTPVSARSLFVGLLEACVAVHMTLVCLVVGKALLDTPNRASRYIADSSYWIYLVHLPLLFWLQFLLLDVEWGLWTE